jgi:glycosyltransferase involved in cell wall biosynthesis
MNLSIIIPAYNEENRILPTLEKYFSFFSGKLKNEFEIIVIPNNCNDLTAEIVKKFSLNKKNIRFKEIKFYSGKGGAVAEGFNLAKGDFIGFTDADSSTSPEEFFTLFTSLKDSDYDGIMASRKIKGAIIFPKRRKTQEISSFIFNKTTRILFGLKYCDTQCGAKIFNQKTAKFLGKNILEKGWAFDVDLLYLCKLNNFSIKEHPVRWKDSEGSKLKFTDGVKSVFLLFKLRLKKVSKNPQYRTDKI